MKIKELFEGAEERISREHLELMLSQVEDKSFEEFVKELVANGVPYKVIYKALMKTAIKTV